MAEGFANPIIGGGGTLVYPAIHSPNYAPGTSGWTVRKDGSAEFSNVTIRGGLIQGAPGLYYAGTPALGNLAASVTGSSGGGIDAYGNAYVAGVASYIATGGGYVAVTENAGSIQWWRNSTYGGAYTSYATLNLSGTALIL